MRSPVESCPAENGGSSLLTVASQDVSISGRVGLVSRRAKASLGRIPKQRRYVTRVNEWVDTEEAMGCGSMALGAVHINAGSSLVGLLTWVSTGRVLTQ